MSDQELRHAAQQALEALALAMDNLREHGDNCFLHDEGEYNSCFCGKDSLTNHLQSTVEGLATALSAQPSGEVVAPLAARCYLMSERNLSGYRLIIGFNTLDDVQAAHEWVAKGAPQPAARVAMTDAEHEALMRGRSTLDYGRAVEAHHHITQQPS